MAVPCSTIPRCGFAASTERTMNGAPPSECTVADPVRAGFSAPFRSGYRAFVGGYPPSLPTRNSNGCNGLEEAMAAKILQIEGLRPKYGIYILDSLAAGTFDLLKDKLL